MKLFYLLPIAAFSLLFPAPGTAAEHTFFQENVLGTSLELRVNTSTHAQASAAEDLVLAEIDRLNRIFSQYDSTSEFSSFLRLPAGQQMAVSPELLEVMHWSDAWNQISGGVFNPAVELISREWKSAEQLGAEPTPGRLSELAAQIRPAAWQLNADGFSATRTSDVPLSLNAIAKGAILDYVADHVAATLPEVAGLMINIGGDVVVAGDMHVNVSVANPQADAIGGSLLQTLPLYRSAVATSGSSERFYEIQGRRHSHLIDARTGEPVDHSLSATVIAESAATADAVATIVGVLPIAEGLAFVNQLRGVECLLVSATGMISTSTAWPSDENSEEKDEAETPAKAETGHLMKVEFEISKPDNARRYRRPYVAVWVEDKDGFPVKTLSLFLMKDNPGPRWHRDLRRWYKDDQVRSLAEDVSLISTISKPTRNPGNYKVEWDGRDNAGKLIEAGEYTLMFEAAREHGTYQLIKHKFEFGGPGFKKQLKGNVEIGAASVSYESDK